MSFYSDASLVLIPSGYKDQKVYSAVPTDGSGDLVFSRASSATRVASNGLIEKVRTNFALYSQDFTNAAWIKQNTTFSSDTVTANAGTAFKGITQLETTNGVQNVYYDVAYTNHAFLQIGFGTNASDFGFSNYDIQNKTLGSSSGILNNSIQDFGTYVRISLSINTTDKAAVFLIFANSAGDSRAPSYTGTGSFKLFRAQFQTGDVATDYIATTSAAVSVGPVSGLPRLDYLNSTCPRLLLEPQRTNSQINSENFASWLGIDNVTISSNTTDTLDPSGYNGSDKITLLGGAPMRVYEFTGSSAGTGTISLFVKAGTTPTIALFTSSSSLLVNFNLSTQVVTPTTGTGTITSYGNGWYRITATATLGSNEVLQILFVGSAGQTIYIWGAQCEAGAYATSYIPTLGTSVTRVADAASKTGIGSLIGVNQGSIYVELDANGLDTSTANYVFDLSDGTNFDANRVSIYWTTANDLNVFYGYGGTYAAVTYNFNFLTTKKIAVRWTSTQLQVVVNGVAQTAVTYGNSSPTKLNIGSRFNDTELLSSAIKECLLFNTTLTTAQLQELTTL